MFNSLLRGFSNVQFLEFFASIGIAIIVTFLEFFVSNHLFPSTTRKVLCINHSQRDLCFFDIVNKLSAFAGITLGFVGFSLVLGGILLNYEQFEAMFVSQGIQLDFVIFSTFILVVNLCFLIYILFISYNAYQRETTEIIKVMKANKYDFQQTLGRLNNSSELQSTSSQRRTVTIVGVMSIAFPLAILSQVI